MNRRQFVQTTAGAAALLAMQRRAMAFYQSPGLSKWSQALRGVGQIPVAGKDASGPTWWQPGVDHYTIDIGQFTDQLHPTQTNGTRLWGYGQGWSAGSNSWTKHLGGIIVAQRGTPVQITFRNHLPSTPIIPMDATILGADRFAADRAAVHLHGGLVPWISDGGPFDWFSPLATGASFLNNQVLRTTGPTPLPGEAEYYYPNNQSARLLWYHDHSWGTTRINAYAGVASAYVIRDGIEAGLLGSSSYVENGGAEIPIVIQDKIFLGAGFATADPTWPVLGSSVGDLWYAHTYDPKRWKLTGNKGGGGKNNLPLPDPSVIPEFFGDTMLANGTVYPSVEVRPQRYRLRVLNACNARFLNLQLYQGSQIVYDAVGNPTNTKGPDFMVIGTEAGFLPNAVQVTSGGPGAFFNPVTLGGALITGPAERWDLIVDFSSMAAGTEVILYNDAPAPFPIGDPRNDYYLGNLLNPVGPASAAFGPVTREIMKFKILSAAPAATEPTAVGAGSDLRFASDPLLVNLPDRVGYTINYANATGPVATIKIQGGAPSTVPVRCLTLNETFDVYGRLVQLLGTVVPLGAAGKGFGRAYTDPATEIINAGTTEIWEIYNLTGDTHPIHFHLVNAQIIDRQAFRVTNFNGLPPSFLAVPRLPDPTEAGWKETVRMNPGEVTRVIMKFDLPVVPFTVPSSPRATTGNVQNQFSLGITPTVGKIYHEYVWHCHILEHEEHDMMRPLVVVG
jgi:spore coat protein A, manganese oxidase